MNFARNFVQASPAQVWSITHDYIGVPVSDVMTVVNGELIKVLPLSVKASSATELLIEFTVPMTGRVRLYGEVPSLPISLVGGTIDPEITNYSGAPSAGFLPYVFDDQFGGATQDITLHTPDSYAGFDAWTFTASMPTGSSAIVDAGLLKLVSAWDDPTPSNVEVQLLGDSTPFAGNANGYSVKFLLSQIGSTYVGQTDVIVMLPGLNQVSVQLVGDAVNNGNSSSVGISLDKTNVGNLHYELFPAFSQNSWLDVEIEIQVTPTNLKLIINGFAYVDQAVTVTGLSDTGTSGYVSLTHAQASLEYYDGDLPTPEVTPPEVGVAVDYITLTEL